MTTKLRSVLNSLRRPSHAILLALALVLAACSGDDPTRPQSADSLIKAGDPGASLPGDTDFPDVGDFREDEIDLSDIEYDGEDGPFQHVIRVQSGLELIFRFNGKIRAREEVSVTLRAKSDAGDPVRGTAKVDFGDERGIETFQIDRKAELTHTYRKPGRYRIFAVISTDDGNRARGGFRLVVGEAIRVDLVGEILEGGTPGDETLIEVTGRQRNSEINRDAVGQLTISFGDGETAFVREFDGAVRRKHVYEKKGEYDLILLLEMNGREYTTVQTIEIGKEVTGGGGGDEFDLSQAIIMGNSAPDISRWAITSRVTNVSISTNQICVGHTKAGQWPVWSGVEGNPWVVAQIGGRWYAGTYEWLRPGQVCKSITAGNIGPHIKFPPMHTWRPSKGEVVYLFMSTVSRLGARSTNERTNLVRVVWPY